MPEAAFVGGALAVVGNCGLDLDVSRVEMDDGAFETRALVLPGTDPESDVCRFAFDSESSRSVCLETGPYVGDDGTRFRDVEPAYEDPSCGSAPISVVLSSQQGLGPDVLLVEDPDAMSATWWDSSVCAVPLRISEPGAHELVSLARHVDDDDGGWECRVDEVAVHRPGDEVPLSCFRSVLRAARGQGRLRPVRDGDADSGVVDAYRISMSLPVDESVNGFPVVTRLAPGQVPRGPWWDEQFGFYCAPYAMSDDTTRCAPVPNYERAISYIASEDTTRYYFTSPDCDPDSALFRRAPGCVEASPAVVYGEGVFGLEPFDPGTGSVYANWGFDPECNPVGSLDDGEYFTLGEDISDQLGVLELVTE